mgnify:CR=1 FL=1
MKYCIHALPEELKVAFREAGYFREGNETRLFAVKGADGVRKEGDRLTVSFSSVAAFLHTLFAYDSGMDVSGMQKKFSGFGVLLDLSRNAVRTLPTLKKFLSMLVLLGYDAVQLYMEDTFEVPGEPYFGYRRGRYTQAELREVLQIDRDGMYSCRSDACAYGRDRTMGVLSSVHGYAGYSSCRGRADVPSDRTDVLFSA